MLNHIKPRTLINKTDLKIDELEEIRVQGIFLGSVQEQIRHNPTHSLGIGLLCPPVLFLPAEKPLWVQRSSNQLCLLLLLVL